MSQYPRAYLLTNDGRYICEVEYSTSEVVYGRNDLWFLARDGRIFSPIADDAWYILGVDAFKTREEAASRNPYANFLPWIAP